MPNLAVSFQRFLKLNLLKLITGTGSTKLNYRTRNYVITTRDSCLKLILDRVIVSE